MYLLINELPPFKSTYIIHQVKTGVQHECAGALLVIIMYNLVTYKCFILGTLLASRNPIIN